MKTLTLSAIITGIRAKVDGSLGLSLCTPELTAEEKVEFMKLQNMNISLLITPSDTPDVPELKVKSDLNQKTHSQRLRAVLYVWWDQGNKETNFEQFYNEKMNKIIEWAKGKLD